MTEIKIKGLVWVVEYTEYECGYGQKTFAEPKYFTTEPEAIAEVKEFNKPNVADQVPDWYAAAAYRRILNG